ncbi:hypothetical protein [Mycoplasma sp. E35C]|uniref:hypothetical protein n=1 Tax=Mycoplasma sp. E35C TaxID=2801918 RepID=UPI001CA38E86|nr:hypothetical protein [Mycoplasma sp. E35C]QZX49422.1 hypothetical protein JJE79_01595 [Mycoplasma sp. E35C]
MARTKKTKSDSKKRKTKKQEEVKLAQHLANNEPELVNVKVKSEFDEDNDFDFSDKSILNDENIIFSGEIKINKSHLKSKYFDTILDKEDLLNSDFAEIKKRSKKSLLKKKDKKSQTDTKAAIKETINKHFEGFFDETEQSLITERIYDGDYKQQDDKDLVDQINEITTASDLIHDILVKSEKQEQDKAEKDVIEGNLKPVETINDENFDLDLDEEELTQLQNLDINTLDLDWGDDQKEEFDQELDKTTIEQDVEQEEVYVGVKSEEINDQPEVYSPDVHLNVQEPIEIHQEVLINTTIDQPINNQALNDNDSINLVNPTIKVDQVIVNPTIKPIPLNQPVDLNNLKPEVLDLKLADNVIVNQLNNINQPVEVINQPISNQQVEILDQNTHHNQANIDYQVVEQKLDSSDLSIDTSLTNNELNAQLKQNQPNQLEAKTHLIDDHISYEVQEQNLATSDLSVDVDLANQNLNSQYRQPINDQKTLDQYEIVEQIVQIDTVNPQINQPIKKSIDDLEYLPVVFYDNSYQKQEIENVPENDYRNFDNEFINSEQSSLQQPEFKSSLIQFNIDQDLEVSTDQVQFEFNLEQTTKEVNDDQIYPIQKHELSWELKSDNSSYDMLTLDFKEYNNIIEDQNEVKMFADLVDYSKSPTIKAQEQKVIYSDIDNFDVEFEYDAKQLKNELNDETIYPIQKHDLNWDLTDQNVKYDYLTFDFDNYKGIIQEQTEFKMFCKKAIDYSKAPTLTITSKQDVIDLDKSTLTNEEFSSDLVSFNEIEVSDWETIENNATLEFNSLINSVNSTKPANYYLEDKTKLDLEENQSTLNFDDLDDEITRLIIEQQQNIKHRLISEEDNNYKQITKDLNKLQEATNKVIVKNIAKEFKTIKEINTFKQPLVSTEIKVISPFATKSLKEKLTANQSLRTNSISRKVSKNSIMSELKSYKFQGPNLIYQKQAIKKLTSSK